MTAQDQDATVVESEETNDAVEVVNVEEKEEELTTFNVMYRYKNAMEARDQLSEQLNDADMELEEATDVLSKFIGPDKRLLHETYNYGKNFLLVTTDADSNVTVEKLTKMQ